MNYEVEYWKKCVEIERLKYELLLKDIYSYLNADGEPGDGLYFEREYDRKENLIIGSQCYPSGKT